MTDDFIKNPVGSRLHTRRLWLFLSLALSIPLGLGLVARGPGALLTLLGILLVVHIPFLISLFQGKKPHFDLELLYQSLVLAAVLPTDWNLVWVVWAGVLFLLFKKIAGVPAWFNPILAVWALVFFSWTWNPVPDPDVLASATPLTNVKIAIQENRGLDSGPLVLAKIQRSPGDISTTDWLNNHIFGLMNVSLPGGYVDLLGGTTPGGALGENPRLILLVISVFLLGAGVIPWEIPLSYFITHTMVIFIFGGIPFTGQFFAGDVLFYTLSGSFIFSLFFLATDYATTPLSTWGKLLFGILCGMMVGAFRLAGSVPEGTGLALLVVSLGVPLVDKIFRRRGIS